MSRKRDNAMLLAYDAMAFLSSAIHNMILLKTELPCRPKGYLFRRRLGATFNSRALVDARRSRTELIDMVKYLKGFKHANKRKS